MSSLKRSSPGLKRKGVKRDGRYDHGDGMRAGSCDLVCQSGVSMLRAISTGKVYRWLLAGVEECWFEVRVRWYMRGIRVEGDR